MHTALLCLSYPWALGSISKQLSILIIKKVSQSFKQKKKDAESPIVSTSLTPGHRSVSPAKSAVAAWGVGPQAFQSVL